MTRRRPRAPGQGRPAIPTPRTEAGPTPGSAARLVPRVVHRHAFIRILVAPAVPATLRRSRCGRITRTGDDIATALADRNVGGIGLVLCYGRRWWRRAVQLSERTRQAIEACYDAALVPASWPSALQRLGESLGAESCTFASRNAVGDPLSMPRSDGHEDFAQIWLENEAHAPDPHIARNPTSKVRGRSYILEEDVSTEEDRRTLPYYRETARRGNRDWWAATCFVVEGRNWCLPLYRGARRGPFSIREAGYFVRVGPHIARIIALAEKLSGVESCGRCQPARPARATGDRHRSRRNRPVPECGGRVPVGSRLPSPRGVL